MRQNSTVGTANHRHRYFGLTNLYTMKKKPAVPRTIDIDILDYEGVSCRNQSLTLPHPGLSLRLFVSSSLRLFVSSSLRLFVVLPLLDLDRNYRL